MKISASCHSLEHTVLVLEVTALQSGLTLQGVQRKWSSIFWQPGVFISVLGLAEDCFESPNSLKQPWPECTWKFGKKPSFLAKFPFLRREHGLLSLNPAILLAFPLCCACCCISWLSTWLAWPYWEPDSFSSWSTGKRSYRGQVAKC